MVMQDDSNPGRRTLRTNRVGIVFNAGPGSDEGFSINYRINVANAVTRRLVMTSDESTMFLAAVIGVVAIIATVLIL